MDEHVHGSPELLAVVAQDEAGEEHDAKRARPRQDHGGQHDAPEERRPSHPAPPVAAPRSALIAAGPSARVGEAEQAVLFGTARVASSRTVIPTRRGSASRRCGDVHTAGSVRVPQVCCAFNLNPAWIRARSFGSPHSGASRSSFGLMSEGYLRGSVRFMPRRRRKLAIRFGATHVHALWRSVSPAPLLVAHWLQGCCRPTHSPGASQYSLPYW